MAELKHLWLLKKISARFLVVLLNLYDFANEKKVVSAENNTFGPVYEKLNDLSDQIIGFVDDKFDKYASSDVKKLVANVQSGIYKTKPLLQLLLIIAETVIIPLITITIFLLQTTKYLIQSITATITIRSVHVVSTTQTPLQKDLTTTQTPLQSAPLAESIPLVGNVAPSLVSNPTDLANATNSLVNKNPLLGAITSTAQSSLDTTKSLVPDTILQKGPDSANQAQDATKSLFGGITLAGNVAQSLVNKNLVLEAVNSSGNQAQDTTKALVGGIPLVGDVALSLVTNPTDLANEILKTTNSLVNENPVLEAVNSSVNQVQETTKSFVGGLPLMSDVAQSLVNNPINLANEILETTNSLVNENPVLEAISSATNQSQDTTKSLVGGIPLLGDVAQSLVTNPTDLANEIIETSNSLVNENPVLGAVNSAANQAQDTTTSLVGGITLVGDVAQSLFTNPTDLADEIIETTNSLVNENPVLEAVNSAANQVQDMTKSLVGGIPLVGDVAQSLVTNPTDLANKMLETTNSLVKENPVLGAVNSAANQSQDTTMSLVSGIPLVSDIPQSLVTNPTDLAKGILNTTNSLVNENPLLGAVNSAAQNIGKNLKPWA